MTHIRLISAHSRQNMTVGPFLSPEAARAWAEALATAEAYTVPAEVAALEEAGAIPVAVYRTEVEEP